ncbi:MAG: hypothetical protein EHM49_01020 [Deltaproteobacteria bacterium]|nr:MAG: hypothetical protein EHM49_01020 [Deltaproteobacteria bacterium]
MNIESTTTQKTDYIAAILKKLNEGNLTEAQLREVAEAVYEHSQWGRCPNIDFDILQESEYYEIYSG